MACKGDKYLIMIEKERKFLKRAVEIAVIGISKGGGPFGAVITLDDKIISEAFNNVVLKSDPTAHAEILAIRQAASVMGSHDLSTCVIYSSCEPCPMCLGAIYWAGIKKVVYAFDRIDAAKAGFSDNFIYKEIILDPGEREVDFKNIKDPDYTDVFKIWDDFEDKTSY